MSDTQVTGTITDPNGLPYSFAIINAILVPGGSGPSRCNGSPLQPVAPFRTDENGFFALMLCPNASISPGGSQWEFNVSINPGVQPPAGFGPQAFSLNLTIAGSSQDLSGDLSAVAPVLARTSGGGGSPGGADTDVQFNDGGVFGGDASFTFQRADKTLVLEGDNTGFASFLYGVGNNTGFTIDGTVPEFDINAGDPGGQVKITADQGISGKITPSATIGISFTAGASGLMLVNLSPADNAISLVNQEPVGKINIASNNADLNLNSTGGTVTLSSAGSAVVQVDATAGPKLGFFSTPPIAKPTVTGSRGGNAALASLLTALADLGLIIDNSTV